MIVHVVRDGGKIEPPHLSARKRFQLKRDFVYARRKMRLYALAWRDDTSLLTGIRRWKLEAGGIVASACDGGLMSYCHVEVAGETVRSRYTEEEFAGWGGFPLAVLRGTQHVIQLLEEHARCAEETME